MTKNQRLTWFAVTALIVSSIGFGLKPSAEGAPATRNDRHDRNPLAEIPIDGTIQTGGTFRGTLDIVSFTVENNQLFANGLLNGTLRDPGGRRIGTVEDVFATGFPVDLSPSRQAPAAAPLQTETATPTTGIPIGSPPTFVTSTPTATPTGTPPTSTSTPVSTPGQPISCSILTLDLGPLDLNLLGLRVQLNDIHLRVTAEPGPGNLLGNLLCAVANLLGGPIPGQLNQIIALLNRIIDLLGG